MKVGRCNLGATAWRHSSIPLQGSSAGVANGSNEADICNPMMLVSVEGDGAWSSAPCNDEHPRSLVFGIARPRTLYSTSWRRRRGSQDVGAARDIIMLDMLGRYHSSWSGPRYSQSSSISAGLSFERFYQQMFVKKAKRQPIMDEYCQVGK